MIKKKKGIRTWSVLMSWYQDCESLNNGIIWRVRLPCLGFSSWCLSPPSVPRSWLCQPLSRVWFCIWCITIWGRSSWLFWLSFWRWAWSGLRSLIVCDRICVYPGQPCSPFPSCIALPCAPCELGTCGNRSSLSWESQPLIRNNNINLIKIIPTTTIDLPHPIPPSGALFRYSSSLIYPQWLLIITALYYYELCL